MTQPRITFTSIPRTYFFADNSKSAWETHHWFYFCRQIKQERDSENEEERDIQFEVELIPNPAFAKPKHRSSRRVTETAQMYTMQVEKP